MCSCFCCVIVIATTTAEKQTIEEKKLANQRLLFLFTWYCMFCYFPFLLFECKKLAKFAAGTTTSYCIWYNVMAFDLEKSIFVLHFPARFILKLLVFFYFVCISFAWRANIHYGDMRDIENPMCHLLCVNGIIINIEICIDKYFYFFFLDFICNNFLCIFCFVVLAYWSMGKMFYIHLYC